MNPYAIFEDLRQLETTPDPDARARAMLARIETQRRDFPEGALAFSQFLSGLLDAHAAGLGTDTLLRLAKLLFDEDALRGTDAQRAFIDQFVEYHAREREDGHLPLGDDGLGRLVTVVLPTLSTDLLFWLFEWGHTHGFPADFGYLLQPLLRSDAPDQLKEPALELAVAATRVDPSLGFLGRCAADPTVGTPWQQAIVERLR